MNSAIERLLSLRVTDVMTESPVQLRAGETMLDAARTLQRHSISGAPVSNDQGQCVGILTAVDFVSHMVTSPAEGAAAGSEVEEVLVQDAAGEPYHVETMRRDVVQNFMTEEVRSISKTAPIMEAARAMCESHIHRLVVLDDQNRPSGLVSSIDLVAAMVKAIEE